MAGWLVQWFLSTRSVVPWTVGVGLLVGREFLGGQSPRATDQVTAGNWHQIGRSLRCHIEHLFRLYNRVL